MSLNHEKLAQLKIEPVAGGREKRQQRRQQQRWAAAVPVLAVALCMLAYAWQNSSEAGQPTGAQPAVTAVAPAAPAVAEVPDARISASGYVVANRITTVSSSVAGVVRQVLVKEGQRVEAGQLLAELENDAAKVKVQRAGKELQAAELRLQQAALKQVRLQTELQRFRQLAKDKLLSSSQLADAELETELAERQVAAERNQLALARDLLQIANIELAYTEVRAPFSGVVTELTAQVGETVSPIAGGNGYIRTGICTIVDLASLQVEMDVSEKHLQQLSVGQSVTLALDAYQQQDYHGNVSYVVPVIDKLKGAVRVKVAVRDFDEKVLPGMGVQVWLEPAALVAATQGAH